MILSRLHFTGCILKLTFLVLSIYLLDSIFKMFIKNLLLYIKSYVYQIKCMIPCKYR
jgi:hypothetical protein